MNDERFIDWNTNYVEVILTIKDVLIKKNMSMYKLSLLTGIKYEVVSNYCKDKIQRIDKDVLTKICYVLNCSLTDLITYVPYNDGK